MNCDEIRPKVHVLNWFRLQDQKYRRRRRQKYINNNLPKVKSKIGGFRSTQRFRWNHLQSVKSFFTRIKNESQNKETEMFIDKPFFLSQNPNLNKPTLRSDSRRDSNPHTTRNVRNQHRTWWKESHTRTTHFPCYTHLHETFEIFWNVYGPQTE